jgi:FkbM family methyltransferase
MRADKPKPPADNLTGAAMEQYVLWAYRLLLGREPESPSALAKTPYTDRRSLLRGFMSSPEFLTNNGLAVQVELAAHDGFSIFADKNDQLIGSPVLHGSYEPHVTAFFRRYLRPGMNVLDVGANVGYFALLAAALVGPAGLVTAVEANADNAKLLEASRRHNGFEQLKLVSAAAAADIGVLLLRTEGSNGVTTAITDPQQILNARVVPCLPLRLVLPPQRRLDFVKIDVEGAEYGALMGCVEVLRRDRPVIVSEFSPPGLLAVSGVDAEVYLRFLASLDLELGVIAADGEVQRFGGDVAAVLGEYSPSISDHIDIVAAPTDAWPRLLAGNAAG